MLLYSLLHLSGLRRERARTSGTSDSGAPRTAGHPGVRTHPGCRDDHRSARAGRRELRRHGARGAVARRPLQPAGPRDRRPPHVRALLGRRHHGGRLPRGGRDRRTPEARQARSGSSTTTGSPSRGARTSPPRRTRRRASQPTAGTCVTVDDGNDLAAIDDGARGRDARRRNARPSSCCGPPSRSGSPGKAGTAGAHGAPLGADEIEATKKNLGYPSLEPFYVDAGARERLAELRDTRRRAPGGLADALRGVPDRASPKLAELIRMTWSGDAARGMGPACPRPLEGREGRRDAQLVGEGHPGPRARDPEPDRGLRRSRWIEQDRHRGCGQPAAGHPERAGVHYGVREHAMGSIMNGMALHGGIRPFGGTFLIFSDYMRPAVRLAGLMGQPVIYVFSHDSIGLGEDGPTHQPVEQLGVAPHDPEPHGSPPGRRGRDGDRLAGRDRADRRSGLPGAEPPEGAAPGPDRGSRR